MSKLRTTGDLRKHLAKLLIKLYERKIAVEEAMASARLAEQINIGFFAEAKMTSTMTHDQRKGLGAMPISDDNE